MAVTLIEDPEIGDLDPIIDAASPMAGVIGSCPGKAPPGCLVSLNLRGSLAASSSAVSGLIDPRQPMIPLVMVAEAEADITFSIFSGQDKTVNAEGTGIDSIYTPGDFSFESVRSQLPRLPIMGAISKERPGRLLMANASVAVEVFSAKMICVTTDRNGQVDAGRLAYYLRRLNSGNLALGNAPQAIQLCARGYQVIGGFATQPRCAGKFPAGYLAPLKGELVTLAAATPADIEIGPLQGMVPVAVVAETALTDLTFEVLDPETLKTASVPGSGDAFSGASSTSGSLVSDTYDPGQFTLEAIRSGVNPFPWTTLGAMSKERELVIRATSVGGGDVRFWVHGFTLDEDGQAPPGTWEFVRAMAAAT
jgi:hypothetical protein